MTKSFIKSSLPVQAFLLLSFLALLSNWPAFIGKVPLPADVLLNFPPWESVRGSNALPLRHSEMGDLITMIYPFRSFAAESVHHGVLPLWNPHVLLGTPFLANSISSLFYPLNAFYYALPVDLAWRLVFIVRPILAGLLMALFLRSLGATAMGALAAGIIFPFSGFMVSWQGWTHVDAALWLPLIFLGINRLRQSGSMLFVPVTAAAFAMPFLAGHPEVAFHIVLTGTIFAVYRLFWPQPGCTDSPNQRRKFTGLFALSGVLAIGLASIQILPTLEWLGQIEHSLSNHWGELALPWKDMVAFLSRDMTSTPNSAHLHVPEAVAYTGIFTLLAAAFAFLQRSKRDVIFFCVLLAGALQVIYGTGPVFLVTRTAPLLSGLSNWRVIVVADFCLAVLAGLGLSALERNVEGRPRGLPWMILLFACLLCGAGIAALHRREAAGACAWYLNSTSSWILLAVSAAVFSIFFLRRMSAKVFSVAAVLCIAIDLLTFSYDHIPFSPKNRIFPSSPVYDYLKQHAQSSCRVAATDLVAPGNIEMMYQLYAPGGYDFASSRTVELLSTIATTNLFVMLQGERIANARHRVLDLTGVKYLVTSTDNGSSKPFADHPEHFQPVYQEGTVILFENRRVLPRAFLVPASGVEVVQSPRAALARLTDSTFDPETSVIVSRPPVWPAENPAPGTGPLESSITSAQWGINAVKMQVGVPRRAIFVLTDSYYPGWTVLVDGQKQPLLETDYDFRGVALQPGVHTVEFRYRPLSFGIGFLITLVSLAAVLFMSVVHWKGLKSRSGFVCIDKS